jgi:hypothetical protein
MGKGHVHVSNLGTPYTYPGLPQDAIDRAARFLRDWADAGARPPDSVERHRHLCFFRWRFPPEVPGKFEVYFGAAGASRFHIAECLHPGYCKSRDLSEPSNFEYVVKDFMVKERNVRVW